MIEPLIVGFLGGLVIGLLTTAFVLTHCLNKIRDSDIKKREAKRTLRRIDDALIYSDSTKETFSETFVKIKELTTNYFSKKSED